MHPRAFSKKAVLSALALLAAGAWTVAGASPALARPGFAGGPPSFGGNSAPHISAQGIRNTNGPNAADRDKGMSRAEDRMNTHGLTHHKLGKAKGRHHGHQ